LQKTVYYIGNYECEVYPNGRIREINYINTSTGHTIVQLKDNKNNIPTDSLYYIFKDHLGSYDRITNQLGQTVETYSFDAWGNRRQASDWTIKDVSETRLFTRGFTGHEHLDAFETINMNGRLYDPTIARFLSPDPYVASNTFTQDYNRYSYCRNNPLLYTDPSGESLILAAVIGGAFGVYFGGVLANNDYNPLNWDYSSGKTWGYMLGGAAVGVGSGVIGAHLASAGGIMANTMGLFASSYTYSFGMNLVTQGQVPVSISFGLGSYDVTNNKWNGIWNLWDNSKLENIGYMLGAMANLSDILIGFKPEKVDLVTEHSDEIGHSAIVEEGTRTGVSGQPDPNALISVGPDWYNSADDATWHWMKGSNNWASYSAKDPKHPRWIQTLNVNKNTITKYSNWLKAREATDKLHYSVEFSSCVSHTSRALNLSGIFNVGIHPYLLNAQMYLWSNGIRPWTFSHFLNY
jgi:RHS repeat-associated protein